MSTNIFIQNISDIPENFINFAELPVVIDKIQLSSNNLSIKVKKDRQFRYPFSNLTILQDNKRVANFYQYFGYTKAITELLENSDNIDYYRIVTSYDNLEENKVRVYFRFYLEKNFLLNIYQFDYTPKIIFRLIISLNKSCDRNDFIIGQPETLYYLGYNCNFLRQPYNYQKKNFAWMCNLEKMVDNNQLSLESFYYPVPGGRWNGEIETYFLDSINDYLVLNRKLDKIMDINQFNTLTLNFCGGILADDIGLGKTFSILGLILSNHKQGNPPSLIICPKRIVLQWKEELEKSVPLKTHVIYNITQFKKLSLENIYQYNVIIVAYNIFSNKKYKELKENEKESILETFEWERVILDEGHEYITTGNNLNKKQFRETRDILFHLKSKYRWISSGTPFLSKTDFWNLMYYLSKKNINLINNPHNNTNLLQSHINYTIGYQLDKIKLVNKSLLNDFLTQDNIKISYDDKCLTVRKVYLKYFNLIDNYLNHMSNKLIELLIRKNTKSYVENEVEIPKPVYTNLFLNMNSLEKIIYQTALDDKKLQFQLCNHIQVSDEYLNILGNRVQTLDEVSNKMVLYYEKNIIILEKKIININVLLENDNSDTIKETLINNKVHDIKDLQNHKARLNIFKELEKKVKEDTSCPICLENFEDLVTAVPNCGHFICSNCLNILIKQENVRCPLCKTKLKNEEIKFIQPKNFNNSLEMGTKMSKLLEILKLKLEENTCNKFIIFSQWEGMLKLLNNLFLKNSIQSIILNGNYHMINNKLRRFRFGNENRVILISSEKANSGLTLTEATHIILVDTLHEDKEYCDLMEKQAIGRAVRIGQNKRVEVIRLIMKDTIEEEYIKNLS